MQQRSPLRLLESDSWSASDLILDLRDELGRRLERYAWVGSISVSSRPSGPPTGAEARAQRRLRSANESVWINVSWEPDRDGVRGDLVRLAIEMAEARTRDEANCRDRAVLSERFELMQRRLVERDRMAALGTMAASVAHDIRSPLTVLVANLSYLEHRLQGADSALLEEFEEVLEDNRLAIELIDGVLESMRSFVESPDPSTALSLEPIVASAARLTRFHFSKARVKLVVRVRGNPVGLGTAGEVCQILMNLLSNAAEAVPERSTVWLQVERRGAHVYLWVADEGKGVLPEQREAIFEPFHTSKVHGLGLGLAISREMARRHGGDLRVIDAPPGVWVPTPAGACFELRLPSAPVAG